MSVKIENICAKRTYQKNGEEKTVWLQVGTLKTLDDGKRFLELNLFPNTPFYIFEPKDKQESKPKQSQVSDPELSPDDEIPF